MLGEFTPLPVAIESTRMSMRGAFVVLTTSMIPVTRLRFYALKMRT
jgi:hypothetical protein